MQRPNQRLTLCKGKRRGAASMTIGSRREIRSSWRRLLFFFLCIALGVGSVVALRSLIQNLTRAVGTDARALMTADVEVSSTNDFTPQEIEKVEGVVSSSGIVEARNETI